MIFNGNVNLNIVFNIIQSNRNVFLRFGLLAFHQIHDFTKKQASTNFSKPNAYLYL